MNAQAFLRVLVFCLVVEVCFGDDTYEIVTKGSKLIFNTTGPGIIYYGRDLNTGTFSDNAFVLQYNNISEVAPDETILVSLPASTAQFVFNISASTQPANDSSLLYSDAHHITYTSPFGIKVLFWIFNKDQIITNIGTNRSVLALEGSIKYSIIMDFWPFLSPLNALQLSSNITTIFSNTISNCFRPSGVPPDISTLTCVTSDRLEVSLELLNTASVFNYETFQVSQVNVGIFFIACPLDRFLEEFGLDDVEPVPFLNAQCLVDIAVGESFPRGLRFPSISATSESPYSGESECGVKEKKPLPPYAEIIEIRMHFSNFINSALDYDPEVSVLFEGTGGREEGNCGSGDYQIHTDVVFWLSLSFFILAICLVAIILCIGSTHRGRKLITGKEDRKTVIRKLESRISAANQATINSQNFANKGVSI